MYVLTGLVLFSWHLAKAYIFPIVAFVKVVHMHLKSLALNKGVT